MFDHRYPGTDLHEIDLAYILGEIQALKAKLDNYVKENTFHLADPLDWNITSQYSACTIVRYRDDRLYLSAKPVPAGIQITNTEYWLNLIDCSGGGGGDYQEREVSFIPTETQQILDVYPETGYDALSKVRVIVQAISNLFVGSGIPRRNSSDMTASGAQVTAPAGYYANNGIKSVQSGSEGTPIAEKGAVTNHSVSVTPSVTNSEGYIEGGTKTGSTVNVTAAELVSGSQTITSNQTVDVTNLAQVVVAVPGSVQTLQTKSATFTPTESTQTQAVTADQGYDALAEVDITVNPIPSQYIVPTGTLQIGQNGTGINVTQYAAVDVNVSGGGYYAEGNYTITEDTRYFSVNVSFQPKYVYAFVNNWRELTHSSWKRLLLVGKMSGEYQRYFASSRLLNDSYGSTGSATDGSIAAYSNGVLTFDAFASGAQSHHFPAGANVVWFATGD